MASEMASEMFSKENPIFASFMVCAGALALKMAVPVFLTIYYRTTRKAFANEEDVKMADPEGKKELEIKTDEDVERARRIHLNDLENVVPFLVLGFFYITTNPPACCSTTLFRVFTGARFLHTIVYWFGIRQPSRGLCFLTNFGINIYMAVKIIMYYM